MTLFPSEKRCPVCKKVFFAYDEDHWGYVRDKKPLCSYSCMRKFDAKAHRGGTGRRMGNVAKAELIRMITDGESTEEIARKTGEDPRLIKYYQNKFGSEGKDDET